MSGPIPSVAEADRLLETLDQLAQDGARDGEFWNRFLPTVRTMTGASGVAVLYPARSEWIKLAVIGHVAPSHLRGIDPVRDPKSDLADLAGFNDEGKWAAALVDPSRPTSSLLVISYREGESPALLDSGRLLLQPFCEILRTREIVAVSTQAAAANTRLGESIRCLSQAQSLEDLRQALVDQLVLAMHGTRASMVARPSDSKNSYRLLCSSGAATVDRMSPTVKRLEQIAELASKEQSVYQWNNAPKPDEPNANRDASGVFSHGIALAWDRTPESRNPSWLIVEWSDASSMQEAIPFFSPWCSSIYPVWLQQSRWTQIPKRIQHRIMRRSNSLVGIAWTWIKRLATLALILGLIWGMTLPYPMTIESNAVLDPVGRRLVHATSDGYVDELLVEDGDRVEVDQELVRLRSPGLELQVEEALGQLRAIAEKRNGLKVAINQLSPNAEDSLATQTRLSTELSMLSSQETHAREMLDFYQGEQARLTLRSPIAGVVVARRLRQELENRPIRRGDPILQVVDLSGEWQLNIQVADRDSDYVARFYGDLRAGVPQKTVRYSFDSLPSEQFTAEVTQIARVIENLNGSGGFQEVLARVAREDASRTHMGATARVQFACGDAPFAFVWSRPLVEFLQKRFRLLSTTQSTPDTPIMDSQ